MIRVPDRFPPLPGADAPSSGGRASPATDGDGRDVAGEAARFADLMGQPDTSGRSSDDRQAPPEGDRPAADDHANPSPAAAEVAGDALLRSLFGHRPAPAAAGDDHQPTAARTDVSRLMNEIADRVLVSDASLDSSRREVRIQLRADVLPDTEVRIARRDDGGLVVQLVTTSPESEGVLADQRSGLQERLASRLNAAVEVEVSGPSSSSSHGQPDDGRSRDRRNILDELEP